MKEQNMLDIVLTCLVTAFFTSFVVRRRRFYKLFRKIPTPITIPFIQEFFLLIWHRFNLISAFDLLSTKNGPIFRIWGRGLCIFVSSPELVEAVFTHPKLQDRGPVMDGVTELSGPDGLFAAKGEEVKVIKKGYLKTFNMTTPQSHIQNFVIETNDLLECWKKIPEESWIETLDAIEKATTSAVVRSTLDSNLKDYPLVMENIVRIKDLLREAFRRGYSPLHRINFLFKHFFGAQDAKEIIRNSYTYIAECIPGTLAKYTDLVNNGEEIPNSFIFNLLKEMPHSSINSLVQQSFSAVLGAADTSTTAIGFTLSLLAMHPEIQQKVYEEDQKIMDALREKEIEDKDFARYEYLTRVIKETLRLYPSAPLCPRYVRRELKISNYILPKKSCVVVATIQVHRNASIYPDPLKFDPDRFLPENVEKRPKYAYVPFAAGPRGCPGYRYALHASIYMVAAIIRNFKVHTKYQSVSEMDKNLDLTATLHDKNSFPIRLEKR